MIAVALPETEAVVVEQREAADPLDAFPGVEMRNDQAQRCAMFGRERLAIVIEGEENIGLEKVGQRDVGGIALFREDQRELCFWLWLREFEDVGEKDALPSIVQTAPAGDIVEVGGDFGLRESAELVPAEALGLIVQTGDLETPASRIELGNAAIVKYRPFQREGLAGGKAAFGFGFLFEFAAVTCNDHLAGSLCCPAPV